MRKLALLVVVAFATLLVAAAPVQAGRRWTAPAAPPTLDSGSGTCEGAVDYDQAHVSSSPNYSRSGAMATLARDTTGLGLGFQSCYLPPAGSGGDGTGGVFLLVGLYARSGWSGSSCNGDTLSCTIKFGVAECHSEGVLTPWCDRNYVDDPQVGHIFMYSKGCGYGAAWADFGTTSDQTLSVAIYLGTDGWFHFVANGNEVGSVASWASTLSCWAQNGGGRLRGALYGSVRWDDHDSMGQLNGYGSRITGAQYGTYNVGWSDVNWGTGACALANAPDGDCIRIAPDILRFESW